MRAFFRLLFGNQKSDKALISQGIEKQDSSGLPFIDTSSAETVALPKLPTLREYQKEGISHSEEYWKAYNKGLSHYGRGWYEKAKGEFLSIYDVEHGNAYFTHLLRNYRRYIERLVEKKKYEDALKEYAEMFEKCPDFTNTDIRKFNKLIEQTEANMEKMVLLEQVKEPEYVCNGSAISFLSEAKKPKGFKIEYDSEHYSQYALRNQKQTINPLLPHVIVEGSSIRYGEPEGFPKTKRYIYRIKTLPKLPDRFIYSTDDLQVYVSDWSFNDMHSFDATRYTWEKYHLRRVDMAGDLSTFIITVIDGCYLLSEDFTVQDAWRVPYKIDTSDTKYRRQTRDGSLGGSDTNIQSALDTLEIETEKPTPEDVKKAFRKLTMLYHPDRYDGEDGESRMRAIIEAYEYLDDADLEGFGGVELKDEYWTEIIHTSSIEVQGMEFTLEMGMSIDPSDWIYGTGISHDGSRIYLGCYSGKTYCINAQGKADVVYVVPNEESVDEILELDRYLHITTTSHLYIVNAEQKSFITSIQLHGEESRDSGYIKYFAGGFIHVLNDVVTIYRNSGEEVGNIAFSKLLKSISATENKIVFEAASKLYLFEIVI